MAACVPNDNKRGWEMQRRDFMKKVGAGSARARCIRGGYQDRPSRRPSYKWKMVTTWPKNFPGLGTGANKLARADRRDERRPHQGQGLRRQGAGARVRGLRRRLPRHRRDGPRRRLLLEGQERSRPVLLHRALRHDRPGDERLALLRRRPGAVDRAVRAIRPGPGAGRQYRGADGWLVQQGDQQRRRPCRA